MIRLRHHLCFGPLWAFFLLAKIALAQPNAEFKTAESSSFEGKLVYSISYQSSKDKDETYLSQLPEKTTLIVKNNMSRIDQTLAGGARQAYISDSEDNSSILLMNFLGREFQVRINGENIVKLEPMKELEIIYADGEKTIKGYHCQKAIAIKGLDSLEVYYTKQIQTKSIIPQLAKLDGCPLEYEYISGNLKMKYTCISIENMNIEPSEFEISPGVAQIPFGDFASSFAVSKP